ncbi:hypothetical protein C7E19_16985 [Stenotrophomonas maltophilia]|nr:hypothetical protein C7E19_16985 [Stenotrophomonas maltophilia]
MDQPTRDMGGTSTHGVDLLVPGFLHTILHTFFSIFHRFLKRPVIGTDQHSHVVAERAGRPLATAGVQ